MSALFGSKGSNKNGNANATASASNPNTGGGGSKVAPDVVEKPGESATEKKEGDLEKGTSEASKAVSTAEEKKKVEGE